MKNIQFSDEMIGYQCIKCNAKYQLQDMQEGCPKCESEGTPSSVKPIYQVEFNGKNWLPFEKAISLGEGETPLLKVTTDDGDFYIKNEALNPTGSQDRKSTRLNSSHVAISYAVFCLKKKNKNK